MSIRSISKWLSVVCLSAMLSVIALAQSEQAAPPPPPDMGVTMAIQGPGGGGAFFHREFGEEHKVVTGAPMTAVIETTRDTTLSDGNTIHTENQSTVYRDSQGRVRREVPFEFVSPSTGATKGNMIIIMDPVAGTRYVLNPQNKTAHQMPLHPHVRAMADIGQVASGPAGAETAGQVSAGPVTAVPAWKDDPKNVTTEQLGSKTILGLQAQGTRMTHTIPAGEIGNAKPITVVTERWVSTDLQIPLTMTHTDPMMGNMSTTVTSVTRGEPDASLFQVPSDYKIEEGKHGDMMYMPMKP